MDLRRRYVLAGLAGRKRPEHHVPDLSLILAIESAMTEHRLSQLAGAAHAAATMGEAEVVEDEELAGLQRDLDLRPRQVEAAVREEDRFRVQLGELVAAAEVGIGAHARQYRSVTGSSFDQAREASLHVATVWSQAP